MRPGDHTFTLAMVVVVAVLFGVMGSYFPQELAVPLPGSKIRPVLLLEFASQPSHLVNVFGPADDPARADRITGMNTGNTIDYLLMLGYGLLTYSFFRSIAAKLARPGWIWFGWMGIAAALADAVENALMFRMVADMANPLDEMALLPVFVWAKFGLLAITCGGAAWAFVRLRRWLLAALSLPAPVLLVPGMLAPFTMAPLSTMTIGLGWVAMGLFAGGELYRQRRSPGA